MAFIEMLSDASFDEQADGNAYDRKDCPGLQDSAEHVLCEGGALPKVCSFTFSTRPVDLEGALHQYIIYAWQQGNFCFNIAHYALCTAADSSYTCLERKLSDICCKP